MADALRQIDTDLWVADGPLRYVVEMGRRMTVVRLAGDDLLLHCVRDKQAARDSVKRILDWDFDRIIVGHGEIVEAGGRELFQEGWRWVD